MMTKLSISFLTIDIRPIKETEYKINHFDSCQFEIFLLFIIIMITYKKSWTFSEKISSQIKYWLILMFR